MTAHSHGSPRIFWELWFRTTLMGSTKPCCDAEMSVSYSERWMTVQVSLDELRIVGRHASCTRCQCASANPLYHFWVVYPGCFGMSKGNCKVSSYIPQCQGRALGFGKHKEILTNLSRRIMHACDCCRKSWSWVDSRTSTVEIT